MAMGEMVAHDCFPTIHNWIETGWFRSSRLCLATGDDSNPFWRTGRVAGWGIASEPTRLGEVRKSVAQAHGRGPDFPMSERGLTSAKLTAW